MIRKKIIPLLLIILSFININKGFSQPVIINWYRITAQNPPLNYNPTVTTNTFKLGYYNINPINGDQHIWQPGSNNWQPDNLFPSGGGSSGSNITTWNIGPNSSFNSDLTISPERYGAIHADQTILARYGPTLGQVVVNYYNYLLANDTAGCTTLPPPPAGIPNLNNCNYYVPSLSTSWIPKIGGPVTLTDNVDWAAWQVCVKIACQRTLNRGQGNMSIIARGGVNYYIGDRAIVMPNSHPWPVSTTTNNNTTTRALIIEGNYSKIIARQITRPTITTTITLSNGNTVSSSFTANAIFFRETFYFSAFANLWNGGGVLMFPMYINNITLECTQPGIGSSGNTAITGGISLGPSYGAYFSNVKGINLSNVITVRFGLRTTIKNCVATNCRTGFILTWGEWGGDAWNSQSNASTISNCIYENYTPNGGDTAFKFIASSGCVAENSIIRGNRLGIGIYLNTFRMTVVKDFTVSNIDFDVNTMQAGVYIRSAQNSIHTINNLKSSKPGIMVETNQDPGTYTLVISNISRWIGLPSNTGPKYFRNNNTSQTIWIFMNNDNELSPTNANYTPTVISWFTNNFNFTNCTMPINQFGAPPGCGGPYRYAMYPMPK